MVDDVVAWVVVFVNVLTEVEVDLVVEAFFNNLSGRMSGKL
jgi:hypothetical protein